MATVHPFPNQSVRALIHSVIQLYAAGKWTRQKMMSQVHDTLKHYGVTQMKMDGYTVRIISHGEFPVVLIAGEKTKTERGCPACKGQAFGFLAGGNESGVVTGMCLDCGCIYGFIHEKRKEVLK